MNSQETINKILHDVDGATEVFFCGYDGIIIYKSSLYESKIDIDLIAANYVSAFKHLPIINNQFKEMICYYAQYIVIVKLMDDGFFGIMLGLDGNVGRAKMELNKLGGGFIS